MPKKIRMLLPILLILLTMGAPAGVRCFRQPVDAGWVLEQLERDLEHQSEEQAELQENLARWYNVNLLRGENAEPIEEAYHSILCFSGGIMGSIEIPKLGLWLPICHGSETTRGVTHMEKTAFPIGGQGNHTVLTGPAETPEGKIFGDLIFLEEGDLFYIHILGNTLTYRVREKNVHCGEEIQPLPGEDLCTLLVWETEQAESGMVAVCGSRWE